MKHTKIKITTESNLDDKMIQEILMLESIVNVFLSTKTHGESLKIITNIICVKPEFTAFTKRRKPKFIRAGLIHNEGYEVRIPNTITYDYVIDYNHYIKSSYETRISQIKDAMLSSRDIVRNIIPKGVIFSLDKFNDDLSQVLLPIR